MKKKILFVIPTLEMGGTNKTLENYLYLMDNSKYEIYIYCLASKCKGYYRTVFSNYLVHRSFLGYWTIENYITRKAFNILFKVFNNLYKWYERYESQYLQKKYDFDTVVAFQEDSVTDYVQRNFSDVPNKIAWVHSFLYNLPDKKKEMAFIYEEYNKIVCVSNSLRNYFIKYIPSVTSKTVCISNPIDVSWIKKQSQVPIKDNELTKEVFTIVSVGHLVEIKNFHLIPFIANKIKQNHKTKPFKWYIIGPEFERGYKNRIEKEIEKCQVMSEVILLGNKDNPYPYIHLADLVACLSKNESFSYVINEGKVLHIPVISNNFPVAYEVLEKNCGWVCCLEEMPSLLSDIINDRNGIYTQVKESIADYEYDNTNILYHIENIL